MKYTKRIQRYLDGSMSEEELRKFRQDLQRDPDLMKELDLHHTINETVGHQDELRFRKKLNDVYLDYESSIKSRTGKYSVNSRLRNLPYYIAVASVVIFFLIYTYVQQPVSPEKLFERYYTEFRTDLRSRSQNSSEASLVSAGIQKYLDRDFNNAVNDLQNYIDTDAEYLIIAHFYRGLSYIEMNQVGNAIKDFLFISEKDFNYNTEHSIWYLALCYLKENKSSLAREELLELVNMGSVYTTDAEKILKKMKK